MRILVAGPPKTGNVWIENLLAATYKLTLDQPPQSLNTVAEFRSYVDDGLFLDGTVFHQHFRPIELLLETASRCGIHLVTTIRNPYDMFVSLYFYVQNFPDGFIKAKDPAADMIGRSIGHRRTLRFLKHHFEPMVRNARRWSRSGQSIIVRYEDLHADTFREMKRITDVISPVDDSAIRSAVEACQADAMKLRSEHLDKHIRSASVGDWRNHLSEKHLRIFRSFDSDLIKSLGYTVE